MSKLLNELYGEAQNIVDRNGWADGVRDGMNGPVSGDDLPWIYCWSLLTLIFVENDEVNPTVEIRNQKITPDVVSWYARAEEYESRRTNDLV